MHIVRTVRRTYVLAMLRRDNATPGAEDKVHGDECAPERKHPEFCCCVCCLDYLVLPAKLTVVLSVFSCHLIALKVSP